MTRRPRGDIPFRWHHVMNRAIARRSLFETDADIRFFLSRLAREVRSGRLEVHAWCVLTTHFHLLVRCPTGELAKVMQRIQGFYARYFNRTRRRDGPLHRGRFRSKPIDSLTYRKTLVHYIDANAVAAGLSDRPWNYRWCSARQYVTGKGPAWLERSWVENWVCERSGSREFSAADYAARFDPLAAARVTDLVQARLEAKAQADDLDSVLAKGNPAILEWLRRKALLADGTRPLQPYVTPEALRGHVAAQRNSLGEWRVRQARRREFEAWRVLEAGLLRSLAGCTYAEIAQRLDTNDMQARRWHAKHREWLADDTRYAEAAAEATRRALAHTFECVR